MLLISPPTKKKTLQQIGLNVGGKTRNIANELVLHKSCLSTYLLPCYPRQWSNEDINVYSQKRLGFDVQLPIHLYMDGVYNWQAIVIFHVHKLLPYLSIVSSKYDFWDWLTFTVVGGEGTYGHTDGHMITKISRIY